MPTQLTPESLFPDKALKETKQEFPDAGTSDGGNFTFTWNVATAADQIIQWGRNVSGRDRQMRDYWPTEPYLAGAITNVGLRQSALEWEVRGANSKVNQAVTDVLRSALAGDSFGWVPFMLKFSQDLSVQDNGAFIELIRDEGMDANSKFKGPLAPVVGIGHLDSNRCTRTGNPEIPVIYTDRESAKHKMRWFEIIPFSDQPSAIEKMNGVGYCAVTRVLRMSQIARSVAIFKDEKIAGRHYKAIHFVSGVSRQDIKDEMLRGQEEANNSGMIRFIMPAILASLDPEKPVSTATIDLASLPDGFNFDEDMKWYISCLALGFGVDYQEFAPLPGGNLGSSAQSMVLHRKGTGKGPAVFMRMLSDAFRNYGILPRGTELRFNDKDEQEALERQAVRTSAMEEMAIAVNSHALTPQAAAQDMVRRGIWEKETIDSIPDSFWKQFESEPKPVGQPVGDRGGNTLVEDATRQKTGKQEEKSGGRLRKEVADFVRKLVVKKDDVSKQADPNIVFNIPEAPPPVVNIMTPKPVEAEQEINRDRFRNILSTRTKMKYDGYVISSGDDGQDLPDQDPTVEKSADGTIVINAPTPKRQVINIKMPKILEETQTIERNKAGEILRTKKKIRYED